MLGNVGQKLFLLALSFTVNYVIFFGEEESDEGLLLDRLYKSDKVKL
jgi:hypothetical protein